MTLHTIEEKSGEPDAWKPARPVRGWGWGATPRPTPHHFLRTAEQSTPEWKEGYAAVLAWLEANGADIEGARKDIEVVWVQGGRLSPERLAELRQRYEDELVARQAAREQELPAPEL